MGQVYSVLDVVASTVAGSSAIPHFGQAPGPVCRISGCMLYKGVDGRPPTREIILHLTGNMVRFIWGFDAYKFSQAEPIHLKLGERVRFVLINDTMMEHPIHLHGLWSELENGSGDFSPYKHTVIVKPAERVTYLVSADTPGRWAFHCHLLYHMAAGMFRTVVVS
jgi:FtsP/CotA-like multicopper oxidase with cupredoxin domain